MAQDRTRGDGEMLDAVVIGGSFAGISAALYLARGRRSVAVVDEGETRNRFASAAHGLLGHDGKPPAQIRAEGLRDLLAYPEARLIAGRALRVTGQRDDFTVELAGQSLRCRRLVLAYGMRDLLPDLPGLAEVWGQTAFQCPYCHGYELSDRKAALWMGGPHVADHARFLRQWVPELTLLPDGLLSEQDHATLTSAGVRVAAAAPVRLQSDGPRLQVIHLSDGRTLPAEVLYMATRAEPACDLAAQLGCRMEMGMQGPIVAVDAMQASSVPGVFAAGDLARPVFGAGFAVAAGVMAGTACHRSLVLG
ncbi:NAD(P)/FAD-dependent oxidoreductase [Tabrizicola fusiformis]|uniref:NAD(P)/FAD-dependent oxidoreductase n=1 Tax=Tabrizicola sp. SY72 TaxID=2741673 RepID=UPI0015728D37|nr:NAD(P)/FAD-dependent oxidoreductase [Tabrizicola sp. SY72]NTT88147.1 NAD(P)/FAD-dependent oxidoreductase [Tabrizicola sp. SY72]